MEECEDQSSVIAFLTDPAAFGSEAAVERIDTHAAIIFLCGGKAYKLKRAVRFSYLDFSNPEKRRAVCEAELALNRRTAPEIYCSVEFIGKRPDGSLALGEGEPIDWIVVMQRFDQSQLLANVACKGTLDPTMLRSLADGIASFHDAAEIALGNGADRVGKVIEGNRISMGALPYGLLPESDRERLYGLSVNRFEQLKSLLGRRSMNGCVRHCHGDLHLANICLWDGRPTLFDCLEFSQELATTDVLYDIAFLVMDLCQRRLPFEASLVLNRYCDMRSENEGLAALPLFLSMRAAVRAHVQASAAQQQANKDLRDERITAARAYLESALSFLVPVPPRLVAIGGLSGTGKSTLAARLAPHLGSAPGARWLRTDVLRKRMAGAAPETPLPAASYSVANSAKVYSRLLDETRTVLNSGMSVIVDGVFAKPDERIAIAQTAQSLGVAFTGFWLEAPPAVLRERVEARAHDASDADAAVVNRQLSYDIGDLGAWNRVDASGTPEETMRQCLKKMGEPFAQVRA